MKPPEDLALVSAVAEVQLANGASFSAKFDGEFGRGSAAKREPERSAGLG